MHLRSENHLKRKDKLFKNMKYIQKYNVLTLKDLNKRVSSKAKLSNYIPPGLNSKLIVLLNTYFRNHKIFLLIPVIFSY